MTLLRRLLSLTLLLTLTVTGLGMSVSRGAMAADGQLCSVTGPEPVVLAHDGLPLLNGAGEPVTLDGDICLDCTLGALDLAPDAQIAAPMGAIGKDLSETAHVAPSALFWRMGGLGRGPPRAA